MTLLLALAASIVWGASDFVGGLLSKRSPAVTVLAWTLVVAAVVSGTAVLATGVPLPEGRWWLWGSLSGVAATLGLCALYAGLASGQMGVVAPIAATGVVVPVVVGLIRGDPVALLLGAGLACAVVGSVLASGPEVRAALGPGAEERPALPIALALVAAVCLGSSLVLVELGSQSSVLHTLWTLKTVGALILVVAVAAAGRLSRPPRAALPGVLLVGVGDLCANALYGIAATQGPLSVVSVLASLYPVTTIALAAAFLHERLSRLQWLGVTFALLGIALIASA